MSESLLEITPVDPRSPEAVELIHALSEELALRYDYVTDGAGNFRPEDVLVARSAFVIGRTRGRAVACGAFRPLEDKVAEIKRMFIVPEHRGCGYSRILIPSIIPRRSMNNYKEAFSLTK